MFLEAAHPVIGCLKNCIDEPLFAGHYQSKFVKMHLWHFSFVHMQLVEKIGRWQIS
jgi:hypothetical protein